MGTPVPPEWPEFEDAKYYCCHWDKYAFDPMDPDLGCDGVYLGRTHCCTTGAIVNDWITNAKDCTVLSTKCIPPLCFNRLVAAHGAYDTAGECDAECD